MRAVLVLAIGVLVLLAFAVACGGSAEEAQVTPSPASGSEGGTEGREGAESQTEEGVEEEGEGVAEDEGEAIAEEGEEADAEPVEGGGPEEACRDSDMDTLCNDEDDDDDNDGFPDGDETVVGSDPLDAASVPENHAMNPGSCIDGVDNDGDGLIDGSDPNCPAGPRGLSANLGVTPRDYVGPCPVTLEFSGIVTVASGRGTVSYAFARHIGGDTDTETLVFDSPGTQNVSWRWSIHGSTSGWMAIKILEPEEFESNRANWSVTCE
jgi:hypothetical protein